MIHWNTLDDEGDCQKVPPQLQELIWTLNNKLEIFLVFCWVMYEKTIPHDAAEMTRLRDHGAKYLRHLLVYPVEGQLGPDDAGKLYTPQY